MSKQIQTQGDWKKAAEAAANPKHGGQPSAFDPAGGGNPKVNPTRNPDEGIRLPRKVAGK